MKRAAIFLFLALVLTSSAGAEQYALRELDPIKGAGQYEAPASDLPVPRALVETFVGDVAAAWRGRELDTFLAADFPERQQLLDEIVDRLPFDARLRVVSIGTIRTLAQRALPDGRESEVLVRFDAQLEFTDPEGRAQQLPTSQEWVVRIAQRLP